MNKSKRPSGFWNNFKRLDIFGHPISLRYQNELTYKSYLGATMTLFVFIGILTYFFVLLSELVNRKNFTISSTIEKGQMSEQESKVILNKENFDIGIFVFYNGDKEGINENIDEYFQFHIQSVKLIWGTNKTEGAQNIYEWNQTNLTLVPCDSSRFGGNQKQANDLSISSNYYCPADDFNITMYGSFSSQSANLLQVLVHYCEQQYLDKKFPGQNRTCKSQQESDEIMRMMQIYLPIMISYFDQKEFQEHPIKTYISGDLYNTLKTNLSNNKIYKITRHNVVLYDSYISTIHSEKLSTFYDYEFVHSYLTDIDTSQYNPLMTFQFMLNENYYLIERKVQTIFNVFSQIGGLISVTLIVTRLGLNWLQRNLFYLSILQRIFFVESDFNSKEGSIKLLSKNEAKNTTPVGPGTMTHKSLMSQLALNFQNQFAFENQNTGPDIENNHNLTNYDIPQLKKASSYQKQNNLFNYIKGLTMFQYKFIDLIRFKLRKHCCKERRPRFRDRLYQKGRKVLEERFDVINLFKALAKIDLLTHIVLSRYQIKLLPYLKSNILHIDEQDEQLILQQTTHKPQDKPEHASTIQVAPSPEDSDTNSDEFLQIFIKQLILQSQNNSKVDKRILKNLVPRQMDRESILKKKLKTGMHPIARSILLKYGNQLPPQGPLGPLKVLKKEE